MKDSSHRFFLSPEQLVEIETALNQHPFMGCPMGVILNDLLFIQFLNGNGRWDTSSVTRDILSYAVRTLYLADPRRRHLDEAFYTNNRGKILCTWIAERQHMKNLVLPVVRCLGPQRVLVLGSTKEMEQHVPEGASFLAREAIPRLPLHQWYCGYLMVVSKWHRLLTGFLKKCDIPARVLPRLHRELFLGAGNVAGYLVFLKHLKPGAVLTELDRNALTAPLILAANALGIPTLTMVHGIINYCYGFTPLVADRILAWGRKGKKTLISYGVAPERIHVVGYPVLSGLPAGGRSQALAKAALPQDKPVVLLATTPFNPASRLLLAEKFCEAFQSDMDLSPVVRLHPSERLGFYSALSKRFPRILFLENRAWSLEESLAAADAVVCHSSGYGFDALVNRKPVVVFDVIPEPLKGSASLVDEAGCPVARGPGELSALVSRILGDDEFYKALMARTARHVADVYDAFGEEAAKRTARCVLDAVRAS